MKENSLFDRMLKAALEAMAEQVIRTERNRVAAIHELANRVTWLEYFYIPKVEYPRVPAIDFAKGDEAFEVEEPCEDTQWGWDSHINPLPDGRVRRNHLVLVEGTLEMLRALAYCQLGSYDARVEYLCPSFVCFLTWAKEYTTTLAQGEVFFPLRWSWDDPKSGYSNSDLPDGSGYPTLSVNDGKVRLDFREEPSARTLIYLPIRG